MGKHKPTDRQGGRNRDRGKRAPRAPLTGPREVSVERVDTHTLIVRVPEDLGDENLDHVRLYVSHLVRTQAGPTTPIERTPGVWLTPDEADLLEGRDDG